MWPLAELQPVDPLSTPWTDWLAANADWLLPLAALLAAAAAAVGVLLKHSPRFRAAAVRVWRWFGDPVVRFTRWRMRRARLLSEVAEIRAQLGSNGGSTLHGQIAELRGELRAYRAEVPSAIRREVEDVVREHETRWHNDPHGKDDR